jgi:K+-sensing histidine kinase KdpD
VTSGGKGVVAHGSIAELWAQAAHDLRQPVQAALLVAKMLDEAPSEPELRRAARHIETSLRSLYSMLEFLTVLSRLEAGLETVALRTCQLSDVLAVTLREMGKVAAKRGIALRTRNLRGLVRSNPQLLATTTKSLLLNAIKYGSGEEILACCRRREDQVSLEIHFRAAAHDPIGEKSAFFELSTLAGGSRAYELGVGLLLLERLCRRLGHGLSHSLSPPDGRLLAIGLPRAARS